MFRATLFRNNQDGSITCTACRRYCRLRPGQTGFCGVRKNEGAFLNLEVYSLPYAMNIDPIEKKPVLHAYPNSRILSFGTTGCDFACKFCQNYDMSQRREIAGIPMSPDQIVSEALRNHCQGIAFTYNEPTIFTEFAREVGTIAHDHGLFNIFVTNGYETPESMDIIADFLDFATVDFKGNASPEFYRKYISVPDSQVIYHTLKLFRDHEIHTEITDLVVPEIGDSLDDLEKMIAEIMEIFGDSIPLSFLRYHPDYKLGIASTPLSMLRDHFNLARKMGMKFVYIGNVPGIHEQNTYCPRCGALVVRRDMMHTLEVRISPAGTCPRCGARLPVTTGKFHPEPRIGN